ncbi:MAG: 2-hydroxyglutaryl-CoA dehydratase, partial [Peptoniphilus lacrimalis]
MSDVLTMGVDVGSTASKSVILKNGKEIVASSCID